MEGLGEIASGTAIAAASAAVAAIAGVLKQVKGLFSKGGSEEQAFQSETDNAGTASSASTMISEDEDILVNEATSQSTPPSSFSPNTVIARTPTSFEAERRMPATTNAETSSTALQTQEDTSQKGGFMEKTTTWVKENPGKSLLVAGGVITGGFLLAKAMRGGANTKTLNGLPPKAKRKKRKYAPGKSGGKNKVKPQNLL